jgi:ferrous iron transport protein A
MSGQKMTLSGSSLSLLNVGEEGTILRSKNLNPTFDRQLETMGLVPGVSIKLEQRSPSLIVKTGNNYLTVDKSIANSIYVRLFQ